MAHEVLNKVHDDPVDNFQPDENADSDFEHEGPSKKQKLDASLTSIGVSPIKLHCVAEDERVKSAKIKLRKVEQDVADVYKVDIGEINQSNPVSSELRKVSTGKKVADLDKSTESMKGKLVNVDFKT